jgi:hypothetical protein
VTKRRRVSDESVKPPPGPDPPEHPVPYELSSFGGRLIIPTTDRLNVVEPTGQPPRQTACATRRLSSFPRRHTFRLTPLPPRSKRWRPWQIVRSRPSDSRSRARFRPPTYSAWLAPPSSPPMCKIVIRMCAADPCLRLTRGTSLGESTASPPENSRPYGAFLSAAPDKPRPTHDPIIPTS